MTVKTSGLFLLAGTLFVGCSSASTSSPSPAPTTSPTTTTSTTLSAAYASKCSGCHGATGTTKQGVSALKGSTTAQADWQSAIRQGIGSMSAFSATDYPDTSMKADYKVLTGKAWK
jgi:mono/diheme cytochrome c family protein